MFKNVLNSVVSCLVLLVSVLVSMGFAAPPLFYGYFDGLKGEVLTVVDKRGNREEYRITKNTVVSSHDGGKRLDRLLRGAKVAVSAVNGVATVVEIQEVPK